MEFSAHSITFGAEVKKLGFDVFWDAERPSITTVKPGSEAESRGIRPGDILSKVNGADTTGRKKDDLLKVLKGRPLDLVLDRQVIPDVDDEGSSSDEEEPQQPALPKRSSGEQRHQADLALLASSRTRAGPSSPGSSIAGSSPPSRRRAGAGRRRLADEDSAEEEGGPARTTAARFNADMGLLHKANQRCVQASYAKQKAEKSAEEVQADAELARKLQEELDAQAKASEAEAAKARQQDADLAKVLQEQFDNAPGAKKDEAFVDAEAPKPTETAAVESQAELEVQPGVRQDEPELSKDAPKAIAPFTLQIIVPEDAVPGTVLTVQAPDGQMVQATVPEDCVPGDPLLIHVDPAEGGEDDLGDAAADVSHVEEEVTSMGKSEPAGSPSEAGGSVGGSVPNLISQPVGSTCSMDGWETRVRRLSTTGISCSKVGRSGKLYQRTFWMAGGCLRMNGRFAAAIPLNSIKAIYKEPNSADFRKLSSNKAQPSSILRRPSSSPIKAGSPGKGGSGSQLNADLCCVVSAQAKTLSLIFHDQRDRDDFAETLAWCIQSMQEKDAEKAGA